MGDFGILILAVIGFLILRKKGYFASAAQGDNSGHAEVEMRALRADVNRLAGDLADLRRSLGQAAAAASPKPEPTPSKTTPAPEKLPGRAPEAAQAAARAARHASLSRQ